MTGNFEKQDNKNSRSHLDTIVHRSTMLEVLFFAFHKVYFSKKEAKWQP